MIYRDHDRDRAQPLTDELTEYSPTAYELTYKQITYCIVKVLWYLCGLAAARLALDDQNLVSTNSTQQVAFERKDRQTATCFFYRHFLLV